MNFALLFCRIMLSLICSEVCVRYTNWYSRTHNSSDAGRLSPLLFGIAMANGGWAIRNLIYWRSTDVLFWPAVELISSILVLIGVTWHLIPVWRIERDGRKNLAFSLGFRFAIGLVLSIVIYKAWQQGYVYTGP